MCMKCIRLKDMDKKKPRLTTTTERQISKLKMDDVINKEIWAERPRICEECQSPLKTPPVKSYFSHLLSKGAHPELRHDKRNIVLHCRECHNKWEFAPGFRQSCLTYNKHLEYIESRSLI